MFEDEDYRERKQEFYDSVDSELEERLRIREDEEKGKFSSNIEKFTEELTETLGETGSAVAYVGTGAAMGWGLEKLLPLRVIPIIGRRAPWVCSIAGGAYGLRTWYANRKKRKLEREIEKEVRDEEGI